MKQKYLIVFIICNMLLLTVLMPYGLNIQVNAIESDIDFTFGNDMLIDTSTYDTSFNMRNQSEYTGNYNATYSFENEVGLNNTDIDFVDNIDGGINLVSVINDLYGHNTVLNISNKAGSIGFIYNEIPNKIEGVIEFWFLKEVYTGSNTYLYIYNTGLVNIGIYIVIFIDSLQYRDSAGDYHVLQNNLVVNTWYHSKIIFNCTSDTFDYYLNGILKGDNCEFRNVVDELSVFRIGLEHASVSSWYWDGIGYSWEDYEIEDNLVPILNINESIQEVDRWEFCINETTKEFRENELLYSILEWNGITADDIDVEADEHDVDDKQLRFYQGLGYVSPVGMERDFNLNGTLLNITFSFERDDFVAQDDPDGWSVFEFYNNDSNLITRLNITYTTLEYWNGSDYIELYNGINDLRYYEFNLYLNDGLGMLSFYINGVLENIYFLNLVNNAIGLGNIDFRTYAPTVGKVIEVWLDYIGVYENGLSISNDVGYISINNVKGIYFAYGLWYWSFAYYNLFNLDIKGNVSITYTQNYVGYIYNYYKPSFHLFDGDFLGLLFDWNLYNESTFHNIYDEYKVPYNSSINFLVIGDVIFNSLSIAGVRVIANGESIPLVYGSNSVNLNNSYFFVEPGSNALRFSLTIDDNELEYIGLSIDLVALNILSEDRGISFKSDINGTVFGYVGVVYSDGTNTSLSIPTHETTTRAMLPISSNTIFYLRILITDKDLNDDGFCTGYISNLRLIYYPAIKVFIIIDNLLVLIVPLMILLIPSLAMHKKFGISGAVIMFILMSVICVISALIPVWLFFIIAVSSVIFLFKKKGDN